MIPTTRHPCSDVKVSTFCENDGFSGSWYIVVTREELSRRTKSRAWNISVVPPSFYAWFRISVKEECRIFGKAARARGRPSPADAQNNIYRKFRLNFGSGRKRALRSRMGMTGKSEEAPRLSSLTTARKELIRSRSDPLFRFS